ncbi:MFS transporter [Arthrobacter sp. Z4-13]
MSKRAVSADQPESAEISLPNRLGFGTVLAWSGAAASYSVNFILFGYVTLYATDVLGLSPAVIGGVLAVTTILSAVTGVLAAWLVDRSPETRWGKARPFEIAVPVLWVFTFGVFAVPTGFDLTAKTVWIATAILFARAFCQPFLAANDPLYIARAFGHRDVFVKLAARAGVISMVPTMAVAIILPGMLAGVGRSASGWASIVGITAIAMGLIGLTRGVFVKEKFPKEVGEKPPTFRELLEVLRASKWIWVVVAMQLVSSIQTGVGAGAYYFRWVVGDLALQGMFAALAGLIIPAMLLMPILVRRWSFSQVLAVAAVVGIVGNVLNALSAGNMGILLVGGLLAGIGVLPVTYFLTLLLLDVATFHEWKGLRRLESTMGGLNGIAGAVGLGIAAGIVGIVMTMTGYDGTAAAQTDSALGGITFLFGWLPAMCGVISLTLALVYGKFDRKILPAVLADLRLRERESPNEVDRAEAVLQSTNEPGIVSVQGIVVPVSAAEGVDPSDSQRRGL